MIRSVAHVDFEMVELILGHWFCDLSFFGLWFFAIFLIVFKVVERVISSLSPKVSIFLKILAWMSVNWIPQFDFLSPLSKSCLSSTVRSNKITTIVNTISNDLQHRTNHTYGQNSIFRFSVHHIKRRKEKLKK